MPSPCRGSWLPPCRTGCASRTFVWSLDVPLELLPFSLSGRPSLEKHQSRSRKGSWLLCEHVEPNITDCTDAVWVCETESVSVCTCALHHIKSCFEHKLETNKSCLWMLENCHNFENKLSESTAKFGMITGET